VSAATTSRAFPDEVWRAPALRGLDARSRAEIEAAGAVVDYVAHAIVHRPGDPADALHVVVRGAVSVHHDGAEIKRALAGDAFGEEAIVRLAVARQTTATCVQPSRIATIPAAVLKRALDRTGRDEVGERRMRALRRSAVQNALEMLPFARSLAASDKEILLDAARASEASRTDIVMRAGDRADDVFIVLDGMLQLQDDGRPVAYLVRGDVCGDEDAITYACSAVCVGPAWIIAVARHVFSRIAAQNPEAARHARRIRHGAQKNTTMVADLYRLDVARSLLVIDQDACVRCGHCASSCATAHEDGVARIVRRGDKVRLRVVGSEKKRSLLVPNSCQHCANPACLVDCPTGAIGRTGRGEVVIREELCTGCGNCAKACPWENIQMAERGARLIAVKCDLCSDRSGGPACVSACPTAAIARIDPSSVLDVRELDRTKKNPPLATTALPQRTPLWPWVAGALAIAAGASFVRASAMTTGLLAGGGMLALAAYGAIKRALPVRVRPHFIFHLAMGLVCSALVAAHAGRVPNNAAGALLLAFAIAATSGICGAILYAVIPAQLTKLEARAALPEDMPALIATSKEEVFRALSGSSELTKKIYANVLRSFERAPAIAMLFGKNHEGALIARIKRMLGDRATEDRMRPIEALVRAIVQLRAQRAQRVAQALLRGWLAIHLASTGMALVLLAVHAWTVWRFR